MPQPDGRERPEHPLPALTTAEQRDHREVRQPAVLEEKTSTPAPAPPGPARRTRSGSGGERLSRSGICWFPQSGSCSRGSCSGGGRARFSYDLPWIGWVTVLVVWWLAHQAGFFHHRVTRRSGWVLLLCRPAALVFSGLHLASVIGVPGDRLSDAGPPTFVVVALLVFQIGSPS